MTKATATAVPIHLGLDDEPRQRRKHIMAGAETPLIPDKHRPLDQVLRDHANACWGTLRGIDKLDSAKAQTIIADAFIGIMAAIRDDTQPLKQEVKDLQSLGAKLRAMIVQLAARHPERSDPQGDSRKRCRVCSEPNTRHDVTCKVGALLALAKTAGMVSGDGLDG